MTARPVDLVINAQRAIIDGQEQSVSLLIRMGRIVGIEPYGATPPSRSVATLAPHEVLIPGLVDTHVHINEPGRTEWEGFDTATRAAAAAGVDRAGVGCQACRGPRPLPGGRGMLGRQCSDKPGGRGGPFRGRGVWRQ